ncbi:MAG: Crp/Fnr family transcriptional regulator [Solirubrobacterales bacterium]|nr:Crp/Fnr family transcriptional regulator [Solirubrobacterales bacterium]MBV9941598.1 Crp/Fnr family transcriptional regulator [Solirubrobacterales bacterium]
MSHSPSPCHVLREDPELADAIPVERRAKAIEDCIAPELWIAPGPWGGRGSLGYRGGIGVLVLSGLMIRRVGIEGRYGAELIGDGDLLRPDEESVSPLLPLTTQWSIVVPTRVAALDRTFELRVAQYPELARSLIARAIQRSKNLSVNMAIVHQARVDVRLHMLLWHLAARWGRVRSDGTVLRLRLTHAVLADLVAARRPTVTTALSELTRRGLVRTDGENWVLSGDAPAELIPFARVGARRASER